MLNVKDKILCSAKNVEEYPLWYISFKKPYTLSSTHLSNFFLTFVNADPATRLWLNGEEVTPSHLNTNGLILQSDGGKCAARNIMVIYLTII